MNCVLKKHKLFRNLVQCNWTKIHRYLSGEYILFSNSYFNTCEMMMCGFKHFSFKKNENKRKKHNKTPITWFVL